MNLYIAHDYPNHFKVLVRAHSKSAALLKVRKEWPERRFMKIWNIEIDMNLCGKDAQIIEDN